MESIFFRLTKISGKTILINSTSIVSMEEPENEADVAHTQIQLSTRTVIWVCETIEEINKKVKEAINFYNNQS